jgi:AcrR family transcriptional regulator
MARTVKLAADRREELIACAEALFVEKGYEQTTVADILERTSLSKGAFYHHFASKEELLDALIERLAIAVTEASRDIIGDEALSAQEKLASFSLRLNEMQFTASPGFTHLYLAALKPENARLYQRLIRTGAQLVTPILAGILRDGAKAGEFDVVDAELTAEVILQLANGRQSLTAEAVRLAQRGDIDGAIERLHRRLQAEWRLLDRLLGLPPGTTEPRQAENARVLLQTLLG